MRYFLGKLNSFSSASQAHKIQETGNKTASFLKHRQHLKKIIEVFTMEGEKSLFFLSLPKYLMKKFKDVRCDCAIVTQRPTFHGLGDRL